MNATSWQIKNRPNSVVEHNNIHRKLNHFLLNKLLILRYYVRKKPLLIKAVIGFELTLTKIRLITTR